MRKLLLISAILWSATSFGVASSSSMNNFVHRVQIEVSGYTGETELNEFPVLVRAGSHIPGFSHAMLRDPNMRDLSFFDELDNELSSEFDGFDKDGAALFWVHTSLKPVADASGSTKILMCFRSKLDGDEMAVNGTDPSSTWGSCLGVWHMSEEFGAAKDSTDQELDAFVGRESYLSDMRGWPDGVVGAARINQSHNSLAGAYLSVTNFHQHENVLLGNDGHYKCSFSGWFRANDIPAGASAKLVSCMSEFYDESYYYNIVGWEVSATGTNTISVMTGAARRDLKLSTITCTNTLVGAWNLLNFSFDGSTLHIFQNGVELGSGYEIWPVSPSGVPLVFGCDSYGDTYSWNGQYDELRLYRVPVSADWAKAEYDTVAKPDFLTYGAVDGSSAAPRFAGEPFVEKGQSDTNFVFSVNLVQGEANVYAIFTDVLTGESVTNQLASAADVHVPQTISCAVPVLTPGHAYTYSAYAVATVSGEDEDHNPFSYELTASSSGVSAFSYGSYSAAPSLYGKRIAFVATRYDGAPAQGRQALVRLGEDVSGFRYEDFAFPGTGDDLFFTDSSGAAIPHEVEQWNPMGESLVRVRLPSLATNTVFYAYYRGPAAAGNHAAVWEGGQEPAGDDPEFFSCAAGANDPSVPVVVPTGVTGIGNDIATLGFYVVSFGAVSVPMSASVTCRSLDGECDFTDDLAPVSSTGAASCVLNDLSPVVEYSYRLVFADGLSEVSGKFITKGLVEFSNITFTADDNGIVATCFIDDVGYGEAKITCYYGFDLDDMYELDSQDVPDSPCEISFPFPPDEFLSEDYGLEWIVVFRVESEFPDGRVISSVSDLARCVLPAGMVWTGGVSSDWSDGGNWQRGIAPDAPNLEPEFSSAGGTVESANDVSCGSISFDAAEPVALDFRGFTLSTASMYFGDTNGCAVSLSNGLYEVTGPVSVAGANGGSLTIGSGAHLSASGLAVGASSKIRFEIPYGGFGGVPLEVSGSAAFDSSSRIEIVANGGIVGRNVLLRAGSIAGLNQANVSVTGHPACELRFGPGTVAVVASGFHFFVR